MLAVPSSCERGSCNRGQQRGARQIGKEGRFSWGPARRDVSGRGLRADSSAEPKGRAQTISLQRCGNRRERARTAARAIAGSCGDRSKRAGRVRPPRRRGRVAIHSRSPQNHPTARTTGPIKSPAATVWRREAIGQSERTRPGRAPQDSHTRPLPGTRRHRWGRQPACRSRRAA